MTYRTYSSFQIMVNGSGIGIGIAPGNNALGDTPSCDYHRYRMNDIYMVDVTLKGSQRWRHSYMA